MPVSVYHLIFKDVDCMKLPPRSKMEIGTYTSDKINVIRSCTLLVVHQDTQCLQGVKFHVTSNEGSVVLFCATTLDLCSSQQFGLYSIQCQLHNKQIRLSKEKEAPEKYVSIKAQEKNVCSSKEHSPTLLPAQGYSVNQCVIQEEKEKNKQVGLQSQCYFYRR